MDMRKIVFDSELKELDPKERTITALVSTAGIDRMDEILDPEGVDLRHYRKNPVVLWAHTYDIPPIGKALWIKKTKEGILSKVKFAPTAFADEIFTLYKEGYLRAFSVGFIPKKWTTPEVKDGKGPQARRVYTDWEMLEYSSVPVPANPEALALAIKKGLVHDKALIATLTPKATPDPVPDPAPDKDDDAPPEAPEKVEDIDNPEIEKKGAIELVEMLEAELAQVKSTHTNIIEIKDLEIADLKYKIYVLGQQISELRQAPKAPEITGKSIADMVSAEVAGVIRRMTGKVS